MYWAPYPDTETPLRDPRGPSTPSPGENVRHVIRGGSFLSWSDQFFTTGPRQPGQREQTSIELAEDGSANDLGFRVVLDGLGESPRPVVAAGDATPPR